jgi:hypothetical protein
MNMSSPDFLKAALVLLERGWLAHPLGLDKSGFPKRPLTTGWTSLVRSEETVRSLPWRDARGLGIVLGEQSSGLCVLDIDDESLFNATLVAMGGVNCMRWVRTIRKRGHLYFQAVGPPGQSSANQVLWQGRPVQVELKSSGTQVAAPPTPGYTLYTKESPKREFDIKSAYQFWMDCMEDVAPGQLSIPEDSDAVGYPKPWKERVTTLRNNTAYIESHKLREAGISLEQALYLMKARFDQDYEKGEITWEELDNSIHSAYAKAVARYPHEEDGGDEIKLLG